MKGRSADVKSRKSPDLAVHAPVGRDENRCDFDALDSEASTPLFLSILSPARQRGASLLSHRPAAMLLEPRLADWGFSGSDDQMAGRERRGACSFSGEEKRPSTCTHLAGHAIGPSPGSNQVQRAFLRASSLAWLRDGLMQGKL
ncbi:unnamed protein product [Protopolystoma xenopodis]|uniref:Uncharacterized protein n=1 Tax=Protopolystoma xenopodis TaxID=117903 RepID=A0A448XJ77_9PLAT|nr:unnamed protein product [Protopolystoma xenopodis]